MDTDKEFVSRDALNWEQKVPFEIELSVAGVKSASFQIGLDSLLLAR